MYKFCQIKKKTITTKFFTPGIFSAQPTPTLIKIIFSENTQQKLFIFIKNLYITNISNKQKKIPIKLKTKNCNKYSDKNKFNKCKLMSTKKFTSDF